MALKILPKEAVDSEDKVKRFHREVKAAAKLTHQNIVVAHDAREDKGYHFLVMELVAGSDLADLVRKQGPVSCAKAVDYIAQAARGLDHAHGMGIVHRDIKPGNLLLSKNGKVKILDMGLARIDGGDPEHEKTVTSELTQAGMVMGTIAYLAPEQALDTRNADARSDIYSLGCTLYYLLTGRTIYNEDTMMKTIMAHREAEIPSLCDEREGVPFELDAIFQKMVAKQPEDRFQSMAEVISALEELDIQDDEGTQPVVAGSQALHETATFIDTSRDVIESTATVRSGKPPKRRRGLIVGGVLGLVILAGLIIKLQTPAGTIVLEIDQPEIVGAQVLIDGNNSITIKTGNGQQEIRVRPDKERHKLQVQMAGFKTFTEEFTYDTGNHKKIQVTLVPLDTLADVDEEKAKPVVASSSGENWALQFDGKGDYISVPTLVYDGTHPLTFELLLRNSYAHPNGSGRSLVAKVGPAFVSASKREGKDIWTWTLLDEAKEKSAYWISSISASSDDVHIAAVYDGRKMALYVNGKAETHLVKTGDPKAPQYFEGEVTVRSPLTENAVFCFSSPPTVGMIPFHGIIDEVRISNVARYTKDFTPEERFENDEHTLALYHFDEGSGDVLKDSSGNGHHGKIVGAKWVRVDDELKVIEPKAQENWALQFDGKDSFARTTEGIIDYTAPITIEAWVRPYRIEKMMRLWQLGPLDAGPGDGIGAGWHFGITDASSDYFYIEGKKSYRFSSPQPNETFHIATIWTGKEMLLAINGGLTQRTFMVHGGVVSEVNSGPYTLKRNPNSTRHNSFYLGQFLDGNGRFHGIIDEVRISNIARYSKEFKPEKRFENDEHTLALYHFDEGQGDVLKDSSGNGHHGKIVGAKWVRVDDELKVIEESQIAIKPTTYTWPKDQPAPAIAPFTPEEAKQHQEAWAKYLGVPVEMENSIGMKFRVIPPGEFLMGSSEEEIKKWIEKAGEERVSDSQLMRIHQEGPQHRVIISKPFAMSRYEVSREEFAKFIDASNYKTDAEKDGNGGWGWRSNGFVQSTEFAWNTSLGYENEQTTDHPVVNVSWDDAVAFCEWLSEQDGAIYRLPTEAEWEYSCRAGSDSPFCFGSDESLLSKYAWFGGERGIGPSAVGRKLPNSFGLFDMHGNVWEWCLDFDAPYSEKIKVDPQVTGPRKVQRGGAFHYPAMTVRSTWRMFGFPPEYCNSTIGFRIVRTFEKDE